MKTGIFGGSFDPVHLGHIKLAEFMMSELSLDRMIIIPTFVSPFKTGGSDAEDRYNMCRLAFPGEKYEISRIETDRRGKSYTADTVNMLRELYPDDEFYMLIGSDQLMIFNKWYKFSEIMSAVTLCVASREKGLSADILRSYAERELFPYGKVIIKDIEPFEVSSTFIRQTVKEGGDVSRYIPAAVCEYIVSEGLYLD